MKVNRPKQTAPANLFTKSSLALAIAAASTTPTAVVFAEAGVIEEVVVTATRRNQSVQDVPYNISAISGNEMSNVGATSLTDVVRLVPGLASTDVGQRQAINSTLILRGINANNPGRNSITQNITDPAVSMYVGEVPMYFNIRLSDVERVEVLRGPQGTLYGSGSVGGTLRFIMTEPSSEETIFDVSSRLAGNSESSGLDYSVDVIANLPISDSAALRLNAGYQQSAGVVDANNLIVTDASGVPVLTGGIDSDAVTRSQSETDEFDSWYVRGALRVDINENVEAILTLLHQEDSGDGDSIGRITDNDTDVDGWEHTQHGLVPVEFENDMASLEITADLGFASFTSATSFVDSQQDLQIDIAGLYSNLSPLYFGYPEGQILAPSLFDQGSEVLTQEFRLVSQGDGPWDWVVGGWYKDQEQEAFFNDVLPGFERWASDPTSSGSIVAALYYPGMQTVADVFAYFQGVPVAEADLLNPYVQNRTMEFEDKAVFGELTYHITDQWQVTGGFRAFRQDFSQKNAIDFPVIGPFFQVRQNTDADFSDEIFKFNTSYDIGEDHMVYFTWSEGFRHGGANGFPTAGTGAVTTVPIEYQADEATNYEIGLKGRLFDSKVRYSAAIYRVEWDSPQLDVFLGLLAVPSVINGDEAESEGLEIEINAQVTDNLSVNFGYGYTKAELTNDVDVAGDMAMDGDPLPGVPEHQASLTVNHFAPLSDGEELHTYLSASYRDEVETSFNPVFADYATVDGYTTVNMGVNWVSDKYSLGVYVNNLTNEEGLTGVRLSGPTFNDHGFLIRPRSYGVAFKYSFK